MKEVPTFRPQVEQNSSPTETQAQNAASLVCCQILQNTKLETPIKKYRYAKRALANKLLIPRHCAAHSMHAVNAGFSSSNKSVWINSFRKCFRLVQFLPLDNMKSLVGDPNDMNDAFSTKSITDLHLIMALVEVNEASRNVI